jgi:hypothetical protein
LWDFFFIIIKYKLLIGKISLLILIYEFFLLFYYKITFLSEYYNESYKWIKQNVYTSINICFYYFF